MTTKNRIALVVAALIPIGLILILFELLAPRVLKVPHLVYKD